MPNGIGRVEALRVNIAAATEGRLLPNDELADGWWRPFDEVQQGQIVARLDDRPLVAQLKALQSDAAALHAELVASDVQTGLAQFDRRQEHFREAATLAYQVERYRLDVLERLALVEQARLDLQRLDAQINLIEQAAASGVGSRSGFATSRANRESLNKLLQTQTAALRQAEANLEAAQARMSSFPELQSPDVDAGLAPIRESIRAAESRVDETRARIDSMVIRTPIAGTVVAVHAHPGQGVRAGDPVVTVAAKEADSITGYVPAAHRFRPRVGMEVGVRLRVPGSRMAKSVVQQVGSQWEPMPAELLGDPQSTQLALPVRIGIPGGMDVRPGEIVDIRFYRHEGSKPPQHVVGALHP